jgi:hypothetical protein
MRVRARFGGLIACGLLLGSTLLLVRGEPRVWGDSGIWLSVAARMLDGDRLYADVVDNKDPLFFYSYAAALWAGGPRAPSALDGLWFASAGVFMALMLDELRAGRVAVIAGFLAYPLALAAAWYEPGATMLGALAIAPAAAWLWLRGRYGLAGVIVGMAMLFKLNVGLVVAAPLVALLFFESGDRPWHRRLLGGAVGLAATLGGAVAVLAARGELRAYLDIIDYNVYYSAAALRSFGAPEGVRGHVDIVREYFLAAGKWQAPAAVGAVVVFLLTVVLAWTRNGHSLRALSSVAAATLAATLTTLALTALFGIHLQMLAYPAALMGATAVATTSIMLGERAGIAVALPFVIFAFWSCVKHESISEISLRPWTTTQVSTPGATLESARKTSFDGVDRVTYMVFGRNSEDGHAAFSGSELELVCRWFHQYPFYREQQFSETLECARRERPMLVLVTQSFYDPIPEPRWEAFVSGARRLLAARYEVVTEMGMSQVWKLR